MSFRNSLARKNVLFDAKNSRRDQYILVEMLEPFLKVLELKYLRLTDNNNDYYLVNTIVVRIAIGVFASLLTTYRI